VWQISSAAQQASVVCQNLSLWNACAATGVDRNAQCMQLQVADLQAWTSSGRLKVQGHVVNGREICRRR
jgi:hypothetical protein